MYHPMLNGFRDVIAVIGIEGETCNQSSAEIRLPFMVQSHVLINIMNCLVNNKHTLL